MTRWACCFLLIATLLFPKSFANSGGPLTAEELISMIDEVKILDVITFVNWMVISPDLF